MDHLKTHPLIGEIFETFVISECFMRFTHLGVSSLPLYFCRDPSQNEIDLLIYNGKFSFPIEIKSSQSFHSDFKKTIQKWLDLKQNPAVHGAIL